MQFLREQFDKILLTGLLLLAGLLILHAIHHAGDPKLIDWAQQAFSTILGALLLLITGRALQRRGDGNGGASASTPK